MGFFIAEAGLQGTMQKKERNMFKIFHKGASKQEHKKQKKKKRKKEEGKKQSREKNKEEEEQ